MSEQGFSRSPDISSGVNNTDTKPPLHRKISNHLQNVFQRVRREKSPRNQMEQLAKPVDVKTERKDTSVEYQKFVGLMKRLSEAVVQKPKVFGRERLEKLPVDAKIIFATTHMSDLDLPIVIANLGDEFPTAITSLSSNQADPLIGKGVGIAGRQFFLDVESTFRNGKHRSQLTSENMNVMGDAVDQGRAVVMAAHNPTYDWELPKNAGRAVTYIASERGAYVVPVAVDIHSTKPIGLSKPTNILKGVAKAAVGMKPSSSLYIGEPMLFNPIPSDDLRLVDRLLIGDERNSLSTEQRAQAQETHTELSRRGNRVMKSLAQALPEQKRGVWKQQVIGPQKV